MDADVRQFGNFLLFEFLEETATGELWRGCRLVPEGREDVWVERLNSSYTSRDKAMSDLRLGVGHTINSTDVRLSSVLEFGLIQRQYYVAGLLPDAQNLKVISERCRALNLPVPVSVALTICRDLLIALENQLNDERGTVITSRSMDAKNVWVSYDGRIQLGWSGLTTLDKNDTRRKAAVQMGEAKNALEHLGTLLSIGRQDHAEGLTADAIPDYVTELVREAIAKIHGAHINIAELVASFDARIALLSGDHNVDPGVFVSSLFTRERSVHLSKKQTEEQLLIDMPEGARSVIARSSGHVLASSDTSRLIRRIASKPLVTIDTSLVKYSGSIASVDLARLLYRYAATDVTGQLHLDHEDQHLQIGWENGTIIQVSSPRPESSLVHFLTSEGLISESEKNGLDIPFNAPLDVLVPSIVAGTSLSHFQLLESCEQFAQSLIIDVFEWPKVRYRFTEEPTASGFRISLRSSLVSILNEGIRNQIPASRVAQFIAQHQSKVVTKRNHTHCDVSHLRLTTKQLRVWNGIVDDVVLEQQLGRLNAIPGIDRVTVEQVFTLMERLDFLSFEEQA